MWVDKFGGIRALEKILTAQYDVRREFLDGAMKKRKMP